MRQVDEDEYIYRSGEKADRMWAPAHIQSSEQGYALTPVCLRQLCGGPGCRASVVQ